MTTPVPPQGFRKLTVPDLAGLGALVTRRIEVEIAVADKCYTSSGSFPFFSSNGLEGVLRAPSLHRGIALQECGKNSRVELSFDEQEVYRHSRPPFRRILASSGTISSKYFE